MPLAADSIQLGPWHGGVRYDIPVEEVTANELSNTVNVRIGTGGQVESRLGTLSYKAASAIGSTPTLTLAAEFVVNATTTEVVIVAGTAIYKYSSGWSAITGSVTATAGDDNTWESANANGVLVATNGVDTNAWKWTGTGNASDLDDDARFAKGKHIAWFDNRLWIGNVNGATNQVWYSDTADIETWGATSFFNFGGIVQGIVPSQNSLAVHTSEGMYTLQATGDSTVPYRANKRTVEAGLAGRSIVALPGDRQLMVRKDGIYSWQGGSDLAKISYQLDDGYWDDLNVARLTQSFALYHPRENEVWFALPHGASQTNMNHIMVYNINLDRWHGPYSGWERNCMALIDDKPHAGDFGGLLWDHETGDDDNGTAIRSILETGAVPPVGPDVKVKFLNARHYYDARGEYTLGVTQVSGDFSGSSSNISLKGTGFTLDLDRLDEATLDEVRQVSQDTRLVGYGPQCSLRISMQAANQSFVYRKALVRYRPLGRFNKP